MTEKEVLSMCHARCAYSEKTGLFATCNCRCKGLYHGTLAMRTMRRAKFEKARDTLQSDLKHAMEIVVQRAAAAAKLRIRKTQERMRAMGLRA